MLKKLGELQRIKNYDILSKEELIYALLRSQNPYEDNYINYIINNINTTSLDDEIRAKIKDIRQIVTKLEDVLTNKNRNKTTKELYGSLKYIYIYIYILIEIKGLEENKKKTY